MKQIVNGTLFIIELNELDSSFISQLCYDAKTEILSVILKNENVYNYEKVPLEVFVDFSTANSFGSFYNSEIKNKYKHKPLTMAKENGKAQPKRINKAGDHKRFIRLDINLNKVKKDWLFKSEAGNLYLKMTLIMWPDGETDKFGKLGMIVQDVPREISKEDKTIKGEILGNGEELEWSKQEEATELVSDEDADELDQLPF